MKAMRTKKQIREHILGMERTVVNQDYETLTAFGYRDALMFALDRIREQEAVTTRPFVLDKVRVKILRRFYRAYDDQKNVQGEPMSRGRTFRQTYRYTTGFINGLGWVLNRE